MSCGFRCCRRRPQDLSLEKPVPGNATKETNEASGAGAGIEMVELEGSSLRYRGGKPEKKETPDPDVSEEKPKAKREPCCRLRAFEAAFSKFPAPLLLIVVACLAFFGICPLPDPVPSDYLVRSVSDIQNQVTTKNLVHCHCLFLHVLGNCLVTLFRNCSFSFCCLLRVSILKRLQWRDHRQHSNLTPSRQRNILAGVPMTRYGSDTSVQCLLCTAASVFRRQWPHFFEFSPSAPLKHRLPMARTCNGHRRHTLVGDQVMASKHS